MATTKANNWQRLLERKGGRSDGPYLPCVANVATILTHAPEWRGVLCYDASVGDIATLKPPPWPTDMLPDKSRPGAWDSTDATRLSVWLTREFHMAVPTTVIREALLIVAEQTVVHPIRDWLGSLKWDRKPRIDTFLIRLAGAKDNKYVRAVTKNFLIGAVARVISPGCKLDTMLILEGDQGIGKSSLIRTLTGEQWYLETSIELGSLDSYQMLRRKWIVELGELDALTRSEVSRIKQYISQQMDTYRKSYGTHVEDFPRQVAFTGTVNPLHGAGYLKDETGARRFQPVFLQGPVDLKAVAAEREQLWAEAIFRYRRCERWHLTGKLLDAARREAEDRRQVDPWEPIVAQWLASISKKSVRMAKGVTTHDVLVEALELPVGRLERREEMRAAAILRACGWTDVRREDSLPGRPRFYRPAAH